MSVNDVDPESAALIWQLHRELNGLTRASRRATSGSLPTPEPIKREQKQNIKVRSRSDSQDTAPCIAVNQSETSQPPSTKKVKTEEPYLKDDTSSPSSSKLKRKQSQQYISTNDEGKTHRSLLRRNNSFCSHEKSQETSEQRQPSTAAAVREANSYIESTVIQTYVGGKSHVLDNKNVSIKREAESEIENTSRQKDGKKSNSLEDKTALPAHKSISTNAKEPLRASISHNPASVSISTLKLGQGSKSVSDAEIAQDQSQTIQPSKPVHETLHLSTAGILNDTSLIKSSKPLPVERTKPAVTVANLPPPAPPLLIQGQGKAPSAAVATTTPPLNPKTPLETAAIAASTLVRTAIRNRSTQHPTGPQMVKCFHAGVRWGINLPTESLKTRADLAASLNDAFAGEILSCGRGDNLSVIFMNANGQAYELPSLRSSGGKESAAKWKSYIEQAVKVYVHRR